MKKLTYFSLYFSEGAPIGFIWWALPAILVKQGLTTTQIATISALAVIPWTFKFLLGPIVDLLSMRIFKLRYQLLLYQVLMGSSLLFFEKAILSSNITYILTVILVHGFFATLQDICIDTIAIRSLPKKELGSMNGIMQSGMLVGRSIFGGAGVYLAHYFGLKITIYILISAIWVSLIILQKSKLNQISTKQIKLAVYFKDFFDLIKHKNFWMLIGISYFATYSYNGISTIAGAILTKKGASPLQYGIIYSALIPLTMSLGALIAGKLSDQYNSSKILKLSLSLSILSSVFVGYMIDHFSGLYPLIASYTVFYFFIGTTTCALYGLLMKNTSIKFAALEFSIFMGIVNLSDSNTSYFTGQLILSFNHFQTSFIIGLICFISIFLLHLFEKRTH